MKKAKKTAKALVFIMRKNNLSSEKIPLDREELIGAIAYTKENDEKDQNYNVITNNCNDFTSGVLAAADKKGGVGDYLSKEQMDSFHASRSSDFLKCKLLDDVGKGIDKGIKITKEAVKKVACTGQVYVNSYFREGDYVKAYTRSCGRH